MVDDDTVGGRPSPPTPGSGWPEGDRRRTGAKRMERGAANGAPGGPDGAGGNGGGPGQRASRRRRPGTARRGRAEPGGRRPGGPSPASGRSLRPPQPCGPGSSRAAAAGPGPECGGGALRLRAEDRLQRDRPGTATRGAPRSPNLLPGCGPGDMRGSPHSRFLSLALCPPSFCPLAAPGEAVPLERRLEGSWAPCPGNAGAGGFRSPTAAAVYPGVPGKRWGVGLTATAQGGIRPQSTAQTRLCISRQGLFCFVLFSGFLKTCFKVFCLIWARMCLIFQKQARREQAAFRKRAGKLTHPTVVL